jgi:hypothetical protein
VALVYWQIGERQSMISHMERPRADDDLDLGLPALDGDDDDAAPAADAGDLGLAGGGEGEDVGLDTSTGPDEPLDAAELLGESIANEAEKWTADSEEAGDLAGADGELIAGAEEGWTEDNDPPDDPDWALDDVVTDPVPGSPDDGGEEGLEETSPAEGHDDRISLPPLEKDEEEALDEDGDEAFARDLLREMTGGRRARERSDDE